MANKSSSCSLMLEKNSIEFVKPSKSTPFETLFLSTLDNDPYNEVMYQTFYVYQSNTQSGNPEPVLRRALADLLVYYYPLAGKLKRQDTDERLLLTCTADGVPFIVATVHQDLSSLGYLENIGYETALRLVPDSVRDGCGGIGYHPLVFQVNKFSCGGFAVGMAFSHAVFDGFGVAHFIRALTGMAAGKSEPTVKPVWERERLVAVPDGRPPKLHGAGEVPLGISPYLPTDDVERGTFNIKADSLKRLKETLTKQQPVNASDISEFKNESFTTFEVLGAYVWRSRSRALKLNPDGKTVFGFAVAVRHVLEPPLPDGYYGNAYIDAFAELSGKEIDEFPLSATAKLIKRAKKTAYNKNYAWEELGNTEKVMNMEERFEGRMDAILFTTDLRNLGFLKTVDFGWKDPANIIQIVPPETADELCMFMQPSRFDLPMKGGVKVAVTLPKAAMPKFREEMEALNKIIGDVCDADGA